MLEKIRMRQRQGLYGLLFLSSMASVPPTPPHLR